MQIEQTENKWIITTESQYEQQMFSLALTAFREIGTIHTNLFNKILSNMRIGREQREKEDFAQEIPISPLAQDH